MPLQSVFAFPSDKELSRKRQLHILQQLEILEWIRRQQDPEGQGLESLWHEFADRHLNFMATSDVGPGKFISTVPQFWLKHDYYKRGSNEDYSVVAEQALLESLDDIESSFLDAIRSQDISASTDGETGDILAGMEESFFRAAFQPQSTSSLPSSPNRPEHTSSADNDGDFSMFSPTPDLRIFASSGLQTAPEPPVLNESQLELSFATPSDKQVSFTVGETSRSVVWSDVKRHITERIQSTLKELDIETVIRIPDYMSFLRWLEPSGALGACLPLLITELKALAVTADVIKATKIITRTQAQVSWQAALCMKMFGETSVWTLTCAGLWACFDLWEVELLQAVPNGPLPPSAKTKIAGEVAVTSAVIPIFNDSKTDFSDDYKTWMNRVLEAAQTADLTDQRRSGVSR
ncbi:hypothetical protein EWM64_g1624 [Hericium alpestre]|uniref:Uncharacterized protein n=1 Tax=Hericium alpestre TaxID=135208 RepID=A0A4Z0A6M9_9AGAM|nr:hypothetical protein EWM64_g1624 [Hericium alpestre]